MSKPVSITKKPLHTDIFSPHSAFNEPSFQSSTVSVPKPSTTLPSHILMLQRTIGNRATRAMLQRQEVSASQTPVPTGDIEAKSGDGILLDETQVAKALRFYEKNSRSYTATAIGEIQKALSRPETGTMSADDVQAVASFQANTSSSSVTLQTDGVADLRTLAILLPFGLALQNTMDAFAGAMGDFFKRWDKLDPAGRTTEIAVAINQRLADASVPPCTIRAVDLRERNFGKFDDRTWTLQLKQDILAFPNLNDEWRELIVGTIYHEARHAEQTFLIARLLAGRMPDHLSPAQIATRLHQTLSMAEEVALVAASTPLVAGTTEAIVAEGFYESIHGEGAKQRDIILRRIKEASAAMQRAKEAHEANPSPTTERRLAQAQSRLDQAHTAYENLPEEHDSFAVEERIKETFSSAP